MKLFTAKNIAIVCPTKNQPNKVVRLLTSIAALHEKPQQIIVADGGHNLKPVIAPFKKNLKITCLYCPEIGQVLQRNHAHKHLKQQIKIVIHLDDDTTLKANAITEMLAFWNREAGKRNKPIAGVSFNVQDLLKTKPSFLRKLFFLHTEPTGNVSKAGYQPHTCQQNKAFQRLGSWVVLLLGQGTSLMAFLIQSIFQQSGQYVKI